MQLAAPPPGTSHLPAYTVPKCSKGLFENSTRQRCHLTKKAVLLTCLSHESRGDSGQRTEGAGIEVQGQTYGLYRIVGAGEWQVAPALKGPACMCWV